jgi:hypothetical protein
MLTKKQSSIYPTNKHTNYKHKMPTLHKIIEKPISGEWGDEGDAVNVIRTTGFANGLVLQNE